MYINSRTMRSWRLLTNLGKFVVSAIPVIILIMGFTIFGLSLSHIVLIFMVLLGTVFVWGITETIDQFVEDIRFEKDMRHIRRNGF